MASTSEKGHVKNTTNFEELVSDIESFGADYNPSKASIKLPALNTLSANAKNAIANVNSALTSYKLATDEREVAFEGLNKLTTRVLNSLKSTDTTPQIDESASSFVRKIQGRRATPKKTEDQKAAALANGTAKKEVSSSQMSFDNRLDNFDKLIKLLSGIPLYAPNETELKVDTLSTLYTTLRNKNTSVISAAIALSNARISRDSVLYKENTGLVDTATDAKLYIKSVFGATSPQYKQVAKLLIKQ